MNKFNLKVNKSVEDPTKLYCAYPYNIICGMCGNPVITFCIDYINGKAYCPICDKQLTFDISIDENGKQMKIFDFVEEQHVRK